MLRPMLRSTAAAAPSRLLYSCATYSTATTLLVLQLYDLFMDLLVLVYYRSIGNLFPNVIKTVLFVHSTYYLDHDPLQ